MAAAGVPRLSYAQLFSFQVMYVNHAENRGIANAASFGLLGRKKGEWRRAILEVDFTMGTLFVQDKDRILLSETFQAFKRHVAGNDSSDDLLLSIRFQESQWEIMVQNSAERKTLQHLLKCIVQEGSPEEAAQSGKDQGLIGLDKTIMKYGIIYRRAKTAYKKDERFLILVPGKLLLFKSSDILGKHVRYVTSLLGATVRMIYGQMEFEIIAADTKNLSLLPTTAEELTSWVGAIENSIDIANGQVKTVRASKSPHARRSSHSSKPADPTYSDQKDSRYKINNGTFRQTDLHRRDDPSTKSIPSYYEDRSHHEVDEGYQYRRGAYQSRDHGLQERDIEYQGKESGPQEQESQHQGKDAIRDISYGGIDVKGRNGGSQGKDTVDRAESHKMNLEHDNRQSGYRQVQSVKGRHDHDHPQKNSWNGHGEFQDRSDGGEKDFDHQNEVKEYSTQAGYPPPYQKDVKNRDCDPNMPGGYMVVSAPAHDHENLDSGYPPRENKRMSKISIQNETDNSQRESQSQNRGLSYTLKDESYNSWDKGEHINKRDYGVKGHGYQSNEGVDRIPSYNDRNHGSIDEGYQDHSYGHQINDDIDDLSFKKTENKDTVKKDRRLIDLHQAESSIWHSDRKMMRPPQQSGSGVDKINPMMSTIPYHDKREPQNHPKDKRKMGYNTELQENIDSRQLPPLEVKDVYPSKEEQGVEGLQRRNPEEYNLALSSKDGQLMDLDRIYAGNGTSEEIITGPNDTSKQAAKPRKSQSGVKIQVTLQRIDEARLQSQRIEKDQSYIQDEYRHLSLEDENGQHSLRINVTPRGYPDNKSRPRASRYPDEEERDTDRNYSYRVDDHYPLKDSSLPSSPETGTARMLRRAQESAEIPQFQQMIRQPPQEQNHPDTFSRGYDMQSLPERSHHKDQTSQQSMSHPSQRMLRQQSSRVHSESYTTQSPLQSKPSEDQGLEQSVSHASPQINQQVSKFASPETSMMQSPSQWISSDRNRILREEYRQEGSLLGDLQGVSKPQNKGQPRSYDWKEKNDGSRQRATQILNSQENTPHSKDARQDEVLTSSSVKDAGYTSQKSDSSSSLDHEGSRSFENKIGSADIRRNPERLQQLDSAENEHENRLTSETSGVGKQGSIVFSPTNGSRRLRAQDEAGEYQGSQLSAPSRARKSQVYQEGGSQDQRPANFEDLSDRSSDESTPILYVSRLRDAFTQTSWIMRDASTQVACRRHSADMRNRLPK